MLSAMKANVDDDPNMLSWAQYLHDSDNEPSSDTEDDFRGDLLNDTDWDGQRGGIHSITTKSY